MASERLGIYLVSTNGQHTPLCDVVGYGSYLENEWHNYLYTGPGQKSITAIKHRRTPGEVAVYEKHHEVGLENDIGAGGDSIVLHSRKRKSFDAWLFGPLSFLDHAYGSLIVELLGYESRKIFSKRVSADNMKYWTEFPKGIAGHFHRCNLLQTGYHLQPGTPSWEPKIPVLKEKREAAVPVHLKKPFVRLEWKVISQVPAQTDCALYEQEGL